MAGDLHRNEQGILKVHCSLVASGRSYRLLGSLFRYLYAGNSPIKTVGGRLPTQAPLGLPMPTQFILSFSVRWEGKENKALRCGRTEPEMSLATLVAHFPTALFWTVWTLQLYAFFP